MDGQSGIARIKPVAGFAQGLGEVFDASVRVWLSGHSGELSFQTGHTRALNGSRFCSVLGDVSGLGDHQSLAPAVDRSALVAPV